VFQRAPLPLRLALCLLHESDLGELSRVCASVPHSAACFSAQFIGGKSCMLNCRVFSDSSCSLFALSAAHPVHLCSSEHRCPSGWRFAFHTKEALESGHGYAPAPSVYCQISQVGIFSCSSSIWTHSAAPCPFPVDRCSCIQASIAAPPVGALPSERGFGKRSRVCTSVLVMHALSPSG
jgi:hypothetical protein